MNDQITGVGGWDCDIEESDGWCIAEFFVGDQLKHGRLLGRSMSTFLYLRS